MNTTQLTKKVAFGFSHYGHYHIAIIFRGKGYHCTSTNTDATDRISDDNDGINNDTYYKTKKQALMSLFNECKQANNLR
jgi:hypothetical protein